MITQELEVLDLNRAQAREIQRLLSEIGYYKGEIDGISGKNTAAAWADFKADQWLTKTETIGPASYNLLKEQFKTSSSLSKKVIDWSDFDSKISEFFTVGEVALHQKDRLPKDPKHRENAIKLAVKLDAIRKWWDSPIIVTSWYRPPHVERAIRGSFANHPFGFAADIKPSNGSIWDFQRRFESEWYNSGKWVGGFGRGAKKGFIHLDLRHRRSWNY